MQSYFSPLFFLFESLLQRENNLQMIRPIAASGLFGVTPCKGILLFSRRLFESFFIFTYVS
jgi:hypothetical protein